MEIRHLRSFCVLAEQLHFTRAAVLLNVAQPRSAIKLSNWKKSWAHSSWSAATGAYG